MSSQRSGEGTNEVEEAGGDWGEFGVGMKGGNEVEVNSSSVFVSKGIVSEDVVAGESMMGAGDLITGILGCN